MTQTTDQLNDQCFARPEWQQIDELPDDLKESLTEMMHEVWADYNLDIAGDIVSGGKIGDRTLDRVNSYMKDRINDWLARKQQEIFDHFAERQ